MCSEEEVVEEIPEEMEGTEMMWALILAEPPLARYSEMQDGTYSINDVYDMFRAMRYKQQRIQQQQDMETD